MKGSLKSFIIAWLIMVVISVVILATTVGLITALILTLSKLVPLI